MSSPSGRLLWSAEWTDPEPLSATGVLQFMATTNGSSCRLRPSARREPRATSKPRPIPGALVPVDTSMNRLWTRTSSRKPGTSSPATAGQEAWGTPELGYWPGDPRSPAARELPTAVAKAQGTLAFAQDVWRADPAAVIASADRSRPGSDREAVREAVLAAVRSDGLALEHADVPLKSDEEVVRIAVRQNGMALQHASEQLRDDKQVVLEAVRQNGLALAYASEGLRADREVARSAVAENENAMKHASEALMLDMLCFGTLDEAATWH